MGREDAAGEDDVGEIAAIGVDPGIEPDGRPGEAEAVSPAGG